jgi:hypothetical protein
VRVLVACEFSGIVREAFKKRGHDAWSCDLLPTEIPGQHIQGDVLKILDDGWDLMIAHPPCTYLSYVANRSWNNPGREEKRKDALEFFMQFINAPIEKVCVENPVGYPNTVYRKPDQIIHPYYFGDAFQKRTCLWLKGLPKLDYSKTLIDKPEPMYICQGPKSKGKRINWCEGYRGGNRAHNRSRTFQGIADAMAEQWGDAVTLPQRKEE